MVGCFRWFYECIMLSCGFHMIDQLRFVKMFWQGSTQMFLFFFWYVLVLDYGSRYQSVVDLGEVDIIKLSSPRKHGVISMYSARLELRVYTVCSHTRQTPAYIGCLLVALIL